MNDNSLGFDKNSITVRDAYRQVSELRAVAERDYLLDLLSEFAKLAYSIESYGEDLVCPFCKVIGDREHKNNCLVLTARNLVMKVDEFKGKR